MALTFEDVGCRVWGVGPPSVWGVGCGVWGVGCGVWGGNVETRYIASLQRSRLYNDRLSTTIASLQRSPLYNDRVSEHDRLSTNIASKVFMGQENRDNGVRAIATRRNRIAKLNSHDRGKQYDFNGFYRIFSGHLNDYFIFAPSYSSLENQVHSRYFIGNVLEFFYRSFFMGSVCNKDSRLDRISSKFSDFNFSVDYFSF